ncbi:unnamed protein product [Oikopleura dioica]|uniref:Uncharacterized protein n=1 Tax=Oikopleura dioica TaxID=34765 RepID=E4XDB5_OIKDI|nr:unnamed protein product [Oikopleura dioica]
MTDLFTIIKIKDEIKRSASLKILLQAFFKSIPQQLVFAISFLKGNSDESHFLSKIQRCSNCTELLHQLHCCNHDCTVRPRKRSTNPPDNYIVCNNSLTR